MQPDVFQALFETLPQKEDRQTEHSKRGRTKGSFPETQLMYPKNYAAQMQAMLKEKREHGGNRQFMEQVKQIFEAHRKLLCETGEMGRDKTNEPAIEAELVESLRTQLEAMAVKKSPDGDQRQSITRRWDASEEIYVMGYDAVGRYITSLLTSAQWLPPVRYLIHRVNIWTAWQKCGRRFVIHRPTGWETQDRVKPEFMSMKASPPLPGPLIHNLIVTVPPGSVVRALEPIKHRLDNRSTICLIHNGLGAAEAIIKAHFPDELTRPVFVLGHMTARVNTIPHLQGNGHFSVMELQQGRLFLAVLDTNRGSLIRPHPPLERTRRFTHLLNLLMMNPDLNASSHSFVDFMRHKLPTIALLSIAAPLAEICGVPYEDLLKYKGTRELMTDLLSEVCTVVSKMPECYNSTRSRQLSSLSVFMHEKFYKQLQSQRKSKPRIEIEASRGWETDIDYLTGYFINRAAELNVPVPNLKTAYKMLKAQRQFKADKIDKVIPFEDVEDGQLESVNNDYSREF